MSVFPSGAWFLDQEFYDPLTWLDRLSRLPTFTAMTRCRAEIRRLSSCVCALNLPAMESEPDDDDDDDDDKDEHDQLAPEVPPIAVKTEKAIAKKKSGIAGVSGAKENATPVSPLTLIVNPSSNRLAAIV
jgi:hypothetical protein